LGKVSENIMATRLAHLTEQYHLLDGLQIGERLKCSAVNAAIFLTIKMDTANKKHITSTLCISSASITTTAKDKTTPNLSP
jgi:hypothetical protein